MLCKLTFLSLPLRALTLRPSLYTCIYLQIYICMMDTFVQESTVRKLTYVCALASGTVRTSLLMCKYSQVWFFFQITAPFVSKPIACKLTYVCALASAHTSNLFVYMHISINIHISCDGHICTRTYGAETHIWLCPCARSQLEPLCLLANAHKYTFFKS